MTVCPETLVYLQVTAQSATAANAPIVVAVDVTLQPGGIVTPGGQSVDVRVPGVQVFSSLLPRSSNRFFRLSPNGNSYLIYWANNAPVSYGIQAAVVDPAAAPAPDTFTLSAAFLVTRTPVQTLTLGDDTFESVPLGFGFPFYDVVYQDVFACSNGRLTFGAGTTDFTESQAGFRSQPPSLCVYWDDLNPAAAGRITTCSETSSNRLDCWFTEIPEDSNTGSNSAYVQMIGGSVIQVVYGSCTLLMVGISLLAPASPRPVSADSERPLRNTGTGGTNSAAQACNGAVCSGGGLGVAAKWPCF